VSFVVNALFGMKDPFGHALMDYFHGQGADYLIRRDDGHIDYENPVLYFDVYKNEVPVLKFAQGLILDVGCGPGRHCIWLQELGYKVVGIDKSFLACKIASDRGVKLVLNANSLELPFNKPIFDTFLLMGNNFGIGGTLKGTESMLNGLWGIATNSALIIASCVDPEKTDNPSHLAYHRRNLRMGIPIGQVKIRVEYKGIIGNWFNLLLLSPRELIQIASKSSWKVKHIFKNGSQQYFTILYRKPLIKV